MPHTSREWRLLREARLQHVRGLTLLLRRHRPVTLAPRCYMPEQQMWGLPVAHRETVQFVKWMKFV